MNTPMMWFLLANIGFAVLWSFYRIFLHRDTFFSWKRLTLLFGLLFSLVYPLLNVTDWMPVLQPVQELTQNISIALPVITVTANGSSAFSTFDVVKMLYLSIFGLLLCRVVYQFSKLLLLAAQNNSMVVNGQKIICLPKGSAPFSFFGLVFIHPEDHSESDLNEILHHERTHVRQAHTLDVLFAELICTAFWINPFVWLLKYDLRENLEFLADKDVVHAGFDPKSYQYHLLRLSYQQSPIRMGNNFNVSQLQNRIKMMNKKRTSQVGFSKYLLTLPLFALLLMVSYACMNKNSSDKPVKKTMETGVIDTTQQTDTVSPTLKTKIKFTAPVIIKQSDTALYSVDQMPEYPGGDEALLTFIKENIKYPEVAASAGIEGRVTIRFIVSKTGKINDIKVLRGLDKECNEEGIRVVKAMPNWKPGKNKGKPVDVYFTLPIVFKLQK